MSESKPEYVLWHYQPSVPGGAIATVVFALLTIGHAYFVARKRTWFCIPLLIGGLFETIGYAARAAAHSDTVSKTPYIIQSVLILIAPILFAASAYMFLGRLIRCTASESFSPVRPKWVTRIFVTGDILCFFIQSGGAGMLVKAETKSAVKTGENIILGGLILQILIFGFFAVVASIWHRRLSAYDAARASSAAIPWKKYITLLYIVSACIMLRNVGRVVEYAMGRDGYLTTHEWPLYLYDFLLMAIALLSAISWYGANINQHLEDNTELRVQGDYVQAPQPKGV